MKTLASQLSIEILEEDFVHYESAFRKWQVESLLNQSADLLDRCLRDRSEFDELATRKELFEIQTLQDAGRLEIVKERMQDDEFLLLPEESLKKRKRSEWSTEIKNHYTSAVRYLRQIRAAGEKTEKSSAGAQIHQLLLSSEKSLKSGETFDHELAWLKKDRKRRKREILELPQAVFNAREEAAKEGGPFDYQKRMEAIMQRARSDFNDAATRIAVAFLGLRDFYGFLVNGGEAPPVSSAANTLNGLSQLDALVNWVRGAIRYLVAFSHLDQGWSLTVSVRHQVGDENWIRAITEGSATLDPKVFVRFQIPDYEFEKHSYVRLRGVSGFVRFKHESEALLRSSGSPWAAVLTAPSAARVSQDRFVDGEISDVFIDQSAAPPCYINRVEQRSSPRGPEVAGQISWINLSPVTQSTGFWTLALRPISPTALLTDLQDIEIEFSLLGRPKHRN